MSFVRSTMLLCSTLLLTTFAFAQHTAQPVDDAARVVLHGNVHAYARPEARLGPTSRSLPMEKMVLVLAKRAGADAELDTVLAGQHDPQSSLYHHWLSPQQYAARFGISNAQLGRVRGWLESQGFRIDEITAGRSAIVFSGSVDQVENAFQTRMDDYIVGGVVHHANSVDPSIPAALANLVHGVLSLHDFHSKPMLTSVTQVSADATVPQYTTGSSHYLSPGDFQTIYNVKTLYSSSINGSGHTIAVVGRTDIKTSDISTFRSKFGLPASTPTVVHNGSTPGNLGGNEEVEADLDVEWSGSIAKNATIKFVVSKSTATTDGVDLSAQYIVNNNVAPVMTTSFGLCESLMGTAGNAFYNDLWKQAASEGITAFVSSGDSGAAGCDSGSSRKGSGQAVSGLASTPYNVAVGGTQFQDTSSPSTYWNSTNTSTYTSAKSYIPEKVWNESGTISGGSGLWASGGGKSSIYAKPSWQSVTGVTADGKRDVPDVSLTSASHDGYLIVKEGGLYAVGGTSAASPSFASIMGLIVQKTNARWGNANTKFYSLARTQYNSGGTAVFHDTKSGNNSVPGVTGYSATTGYDRSTGLGSVNVGTLVKSW
jgi:pseudomonalisin